MPLPQVRRLTLVDDSWIPVIAGLVGAGGAVTAQIVAAAFTNRRHGERLDWERAEAEMNRRDTRSARLLDLRREHFSLFLLTAERALTEGHDASRTRDSTRMDVRRAGLNKLKDSIRELEAYESEINLLTGDLEHVLSELIEKFQQWENQIAQDFAGRPDGPTPGWESMLAQVAECRSAMRDALGA